MASRRLAVLAILGALLAAQTAEARNFQIKGKNELCGGIGFAGSLTDWTPGGFKWFNDYSRKLSKRTWFNVQFNIVFCGGGCRRWDWDNNGACETAWSTTKTAQYRFGLPTLHNVRLRVRDSWGAIGAARATIWLSGADCEGDLFLPVVVR